MARRKRKHELNGTWHTVRPFMFMEYNPQLVPLYESATRFLEGMVPVHLKAVSISRDPRDTRVQLQKGVRIRDVRALVDVFLLLRGV